MDWFMFVLVISGLLNQPEPGALRRLFLVYVLQLLVEMSFNCLFNKQVWILG